MSTQAVISFKDQHEEFHVFRHWDGYPSAVIPDIDALFKSGNAWPLPRFEASEASAAMIATYKKEPGNYRIVNTHMGRDWSYLVQVKNGLLWIEISGPMDYPVDGSIDEMLIWAKDKG